MVQKCNKVQPKHDKVTQNMHGMTKTPSEFFATLKSAEVEIKKEHVVFMVNKTTEFKRSSRRDKGRKGI